MSTAEAPTAHADGLHMARALELAQRGLYTTDPNPRVGCVLVQGGRVIGEGWHRRAGEPHAEIVALRSATAALRGTTAYVTLEPCSHTGRTPPCTEALIAAGVARVVCAVRDPNPLVAGGGIERLRAAGIDITMGVLAEQARALNPGFFSRFERRRPFIRLKLAMSLDARTAPPGGGRLWITGEAARADVQHWRARSSAVLTGAGTVRIDDPRLDVRLTYGPWIRQPLRVVLDPNLSCPPTARIYVDDGAVIFAAAAAGGAGQDAGTREPAAPCAEPEMLAGRIPVARVARAAGGLDLRRVVQRLAGLEVNELLVECGARLAAAFLAADLVDELILYVAPTFLGTEAAPLAGLRGAADAGLLRRFTFREHCLIGADLRLVLTPI